jgi:hypothetical protein
MRRELVFLFVSKRKCREYLKLKQLEELSDRTQA